MCKRANTSEAVVVRTCKDGPYEFDDFEFDRTSITQFNVLCDNESVFRSVRHHPDSTTCHLLLYFQAAFTGCCYMIGLLVGSFISGYVSDIYGRKIGLLGSIIVSSSASLVGSFMPTYWSYLALRIVTGIGAVGLFSATFTMTIELMGSKQVRIQQTVQPAIKKY